MDLMQLLSDDRGVSPVIGVILMVAITVILAAVIGTFVLGLGSNVGNNAPSATFNYEYENVSSGTGTQYVNITDQGGDSLDAGKINVSIGDDSLQTNTEDSTGNISIPSGGAWPDTVTAGDTLTVTDNSNRGIEANTDVQLIWKSSGGSSSIISSSTTPQ